MFAAYAFTFVAGWLGDRLLGDPPHWPHPVVWFGNAISAGEKKLNRGENRSKKGTFLALGLIIGIFGICYTLLDYVSNISPWLEHIITVIGVFYCLAGKTLIQEVKAVFESVDRSTEEGRKQLSRIVGRDTSDLTPQEIRTAALETLAENLSDGVIAPMFWFAILGLPGMMAYKMINTLDSMIGYKNDRYIDFGRTAAQLDDLANYIPARITAFLMLHVAGMWYKRDFVHTYGPCHLSPNSGYPEAALAAILVCRFGGTHVYYGQVVEKPYIGTTQKDFTTEDMLAAIRINSNTELVMGIFVTIFISIIN